MAKKYISYFMTLMMLGTPAILKAQNEPQEGLNLKEELKSEANRKKVSSDYLTYLDHFSSSPGAGVLVGVTEQTTRTDDASYTRGGPKVSFSISSQEIIDATAVAKTNGLVFEIGEGGVVSFILVSADVVQASNFSSISHFKYGGRIFRVLPNMRSYNDKDEELLKIERFNWVEVDLPMPVFKLGEEKSPVRLLFGPNLHGELSVRNMIPRSPLKDQYSNLPIEHIHNNQAASVSAGWNVLVLLGEPGRKAWQLGGTINAMRERSTEEGLSKYNVTQQGFKVFLASPVFDTNMASNDPIGDRTTMQFVVGYSKSSSDVDTFVTLNPDSNNNNENSWERFELPPFDLDEEAIYFDMIIRF